MARKATRDHNLLKELIWDYFRGGEEHIYGLSVVSNTPLSPSREERGLISISIKVGGSVTAKSRSNMNCAASFISFVNMSARFFSH